MPGVFSVVDPSACQTTYQSRSCQREFSKSRIKYTQFIFRRNFHLYLYVFHAGHNLAAKMTNMIPHVCGRRPMPFIMTRRSE